MTASQLHSLAFGSSGSQHTNVGYAYHTHTDSHTHTHIHVYTLHSAHTHTHKGQSNYSACWQSLRCGDWVNKVLRFTCTVQKLIPTNTHTHTHAASHIHTLWRCFVVCYFFVVPQSQIELNYTENCIGKTQIVLENQQQMKSWCRGELEGIVMPRTVHTL